jgi:hypothetical protein
LQVNFLITIFKFAVKEKSFTVLNKETQNKIRWIYLDGCIPNSTMTFFPVKIYSDDPWKNLKSTRLPISGAVMVDSKLVNILMLMSLLVESTNKKKSCKTFSITYFQDQNYIYVNRKKKKEKSYTCHNVTNINLKWYFWSYLERKKKNLIFFSFCLIFFLTVYYWYKL